jgi:hypothetical protein
MADNSTPKFAEYFTNGTPAEIEVALLEAELGVVVDWDEDDDIIVLDFADFVGGDLSCRRTTDNDLQVTYKDRSIRAGLKGENEDRDRTVRAIHAMLTPDFEIRVLRSSLGTDTLCYVVQRPATWQSVEKASPDVLRELFLPFSDEIGFDYTDE